MKKPSWRPLPTPARTNHRNALEEYDHNLVKSVAEKEGLSAARRPSSITRASWSRAWEEVKKRRHARVQEPGFDQTLELDHARQGLRQRTHSVYTGLFFAPTGGVAMTRASTPLPPRLGTPGGAGRGTLPGAALAASVVTGVQGFSGQSTGRCENLHDWYFQPDQPGPHLHWWRRPSSGGGHSRRGLCRLCLCRRRDKIIRKS